MSDINLTLDDGAIAVTVLDESLALTLDDTAVTVVIDDDEISVTLDDAGDIVVTLYDEPINLTIDDSDIVVTLPEGVPGPAGAGVPTGGTAGQVLAKIDGDDFNTEWVTPSAGGASFTATLTAAETLAPRDLIAINASGQMVKADADDPAKFSVGYVTGAVTSGASGTANLLGGIITGFTGLTPGALYYLSATAGSITTTKPTSGIVQAVGVAISSTSLSYIFSPITIRY